MPTTMMAGFAACAMLAGVAEASADVPPIAPLLAADSFVADELLYKGKLDPATAAELVPLHTLDAVAECFRRRAVPFTRHRVRLPTSVLPDGVWAQVDKLPPGEPLVIPQADGGVVLVIVKRHATPSI